MADMPEFIDGANETPDHIADQLIPILAMWGLPRLAAKSVALRMMTRLNRMTDDEYAIVSGGMRIKGGKPDGSTHQN
jgi:hypothetical protein